MELHIPSLKTYVFTTAAAKARQARVTEQLTCLGFTNWQFISGEATEPYWQGIKADYLRVLREQGPVLVLEDDIEATADFAPTITVPDDADVVYLGGGPASPPAAVRMVQTRVKDTKQSAHGNALHTPIDDTWVRVESMFYTHALIHLTATCKEAFCRAIAMSPNSVDFSLAFVQWCWKCIITRKVMFWQNDGHHEETKWGIE